MKLVKVDNMHNTVSEDNHQARVRFKLVSQATFRIFAGWLI